MQQRWTVSARKNWRRKAATMRAPVYHEDEPFVRMVSVPNELWQVQVRVAEKGSRDRSNWMDLHTPCDRETAKSMMNNRCLREVFVTAA